MNNVKRVKGKNSIYIDYEKVNARRIERGMTCAEIGMMCGRTDGWYTGLKKNKTTAQAAALLAGSLDFDLDEIIYDPNAPKEPEQTEIETNSIDITDVFNDSLAETSRKFEEQHAEALAEQKKQTEELAKIQAQISALGINLLSIAGSLTKIANSLEVREPDVKTDNVKHAESILKSMTQDTGEAQAEKYNRACDMRSINEKERVRALDNLNCQYQWRTTKSGGRMCYVVRGC